MRRDGANCGFESMTITKGSAKSENCKSPLPLGVLKDEKSVCKLLCRGLEM